MKNKFLILITAMSLMACRDSQDKETTKVEKQTNTAQVIQTSEVSNSQSSEKPKNIEPAPKKLATIDYFTHDITDSLPYSSYEQTRLFMYMAHAARDRTKIENCMTNSYALTAYGFALQAKGEFKSAKIFYDRAAEKGNPYAENRLGELYLFGFGVKKDINQAKYWFERSAQTGYYFPQVALGAIYLDFPFNSKNVFMSSMGGLEFPYTKVQNARMGANADTQQAAYWLSLAIQRGDKNAKDMMRHFNLAIDENAHQPKAELTELDKSKYRKTCYSMRDYY